VIAAIHSENQSEGSIPHPGFGLNPCETTLEDVISYMISGMTTTV